MNDATFAHVCWAAADVQSLAPRLSDEQANDWLTRNEKHIQDAMVEHGWTAIESLLHWDGIDCSDPEETPA